MQRRPEVLLFESIAEVPSDFGPSAVTIGKFDGVHAGHRAVIADLARAAAEQHLVSTVVTFDRNPLAVLAPAKCPESLVSNAQKAELLADAGVAATLIIPFDLEFSRNPPEKFVTDILVKALHAKVVLVGADFRFGAGGAGTVELLERLAPELGFEVRRIPEVAPGGSRKASSTWIRELLEAGDVSAATTLLERPPSIRAEVVHGEQRGRELGYPTANLARESEGLIPADGVYAAIATIDGVRYPAAVSVGNNPTFEGVPQKQVEAHLIDQKLDLYGRQITVEFVEYIRGMRKFESMDALSTAMRADERRIRQILGVPARP